METRDADPIALGSCLVSLLDPNPGEEVAFHRWYERDHFYAGCLIGPWFFAGRRFVATRPLKDLRFPEPSPAPGEIRRGSYLALYWILAGHHDEAEHWAVTQVQHLIASDRMLPSRRPVHAGFYRYRWGAFRDVDGVPAELALDHPYAGVVLLMIDREPDADPGELERFLREQQLPRILSESPAAICLGFEPLALPDAAPAYLTRPSGLERRSLLIFFLEEDPRRNWRQRFEPQARALRESGLVSIRWAAPFIPTIPGTDRYTDELW